MGRRDPRTATLDPENWRANVSSEKLYRNEYDRILNHPSAEDAVKRMAVADGIGADNRLVVAAIGECFKASSRLLPPPEPVGMRDVADLRRIQRKVRGLMSWGVHPEHCGLYGRDVELPRRTFADDEVLECLAMTEATLRYALKVQEKRGVGRPKDTRKHDLAVALESLFRRELKTPLYGAIGDWIKAAFDDGTRWNDRRVKDLVKNNGG
jgi:hypothetical protein